MNANACQIPALAESGIGSLCTTCARRGNCLKEFAAQQIGERMDDGTYQIQLLDECHDYERSGAGGVPHGSLRPQLFQAEVRDLCCGCPSAADGACRKRGDLDGLARVSMRDGAYVHVAVIVCKPAGGLLRISEPPKRAP